ncbi:MAG: hypothetical protein HUJ80_08010, partial [Firmicutes bacterium]|nr:hypothetical protein [Bacillota bacterium]
RSKGRSAGIALVIAGAVIVLKVLVPEIKMMLLFGIGMVAAGLFLIFKGNE